MAICLEHIFCLKPPSFENMRKLDEYKRDIERVTAKMEEFADTARDEGAQEQLNEEKKKLNDKEKRSNNREKVLNNREQRMNDKEKELNDREKELNAREERFGDKEKDLNAKRKRHNYEAGNVDKAGKAGSSQPSAGVTSSMAS